MELLPAKMCTDPLDGIYQPMAGKPCHYFDSENVVFKLHTSNELSSSVYFAAGEEETKAGSKRYVSI